MATAMAVLQHERQLTAADMREHVNLIQTVMKAVMKADVHYGVIPGTPKPTLYKPGAEVLAATFRIAVSYRVEDLSTEDCIRYRVVAVGTHQTTGVVLGEGMGESSSNEEKYKWRKATNREFDAAPENRRRIKYGYSKRDREEYEIRQVRAEVADVANTILKMACKRAQVAMTLNVVAASDIFAQDIEDLPEHLRGTAGDDEGGDEGDNPPPAPRAKSEAGAKSDAKPEEGSNEPLKPGQVKILRVKMEGAGLSDAEFETKFGCKPEALPMKKINDALAWCADPTQ